MVGLTDIKYIGDQDLNTYAYQDFFSLEGEKIDEAYKYKWEFDS